MSKYNAADPVFQVRRVLNFGLFKVRLYRHVAIPVPPPPRREREIIASGCGVPAVEVDTNGNARIDFGPAGRLYMENSVAASVWARLGLGLNRANDDDTPPLQEIS